MTLIEKLPEPKVDDPIEALIPEARQRPRRRRARVSTIVTGLVVSVLAIVASVIWGRADTGSNVDNKPVRSAAGALPPYRATQLTVTGGAGNGAAIWFPWIIRYKNISSSSCALTGYPTVVGIDKWTGALRSHAHARLVRRRLGVAPADAHGRTSCSHRRRVLDDRCNRQ
jgi:hypothetical protein